MAQDNPQPSASESTLETPLNQSTSAEQDDSETQDKFQLGFSLGGDAPSATELPACGHESASGTEGFGFTLDTDASPMDDSTSQHAPMTDADLVVESESVNAASITPEASSSESAHVPDDPESAHTEAESSQPLRALPQAASVLAAEDSFTADTQGTGLGVNPPPALGPSAFANSAFDEGNGFDDLFKESPYFNPVWDSGASPEQPSQSQTPFPGTSPSPQVQTGNDAGDRSKPQVRVRMHHRSQNILCLGFRGLDCLAKLGEMMSHFQQSTVYHRLCVSAPETLPLAY